MRFKLVTLLSLILLSSLTAAAQDAMPTKEETVRFIDKKFKEVEGRSAWSKTGFIEVSFTLRGDKVEIVERSQGLNMITRFNPAHISEARLVRTADGKLSTGADRDGVTSIAIRFPPKMVEVNANSEPKRFEEWAYVYYIYTTGNAEKLVKAIHHLRDLAKAEDELFTN